MRKQFHRSAHFVALETAGSAVRLNSPIDCYTFPFHSPILKMKKIGVIGGGQLAWMMASAAPELGIELVVQTPNSSDSAVALAAETVFAKVDDAKATAILASKCEVITFENEFVDLEALGKLADEGVCFRPQLSVLAPLLDKYNQRVYLQDIGLPVPKFTTLESPQLPAGWSFPVVVKARRHGYDGQGTFIVKDQESLEGILELYPHTPLLIEEFIPFDRELAVIVARGVTGEIVVYPVVETQQEDRVCRRVFTAVNLSTNARDRLHAIAHTLMDKLQAIGVFGIELFHTADGRVLVNEIAPRTHNSGHLTIEACATSQFSQLLRAAAGLPLGSAELTCGSAVMINLLGFETAQSDYLEKRQQLAQIPNAKVYWYGKSQSKPGRKLGHVTVILDDDNRDRANAIAQQVEDIWR
jgi:5-(carboxyamino)imidazole ribonucleotide synthase